jgi:hypothetical protein
MLAVPDTVPQQDVERNILRLDPKGNISWIVSAQPPVNARSPFTGIGLDDQKRLTGYRWDGEKFEIDVNTGNAKPLQLSR